MGLTDITVKNFKAADKRIEIADGGGLYLVVQPSGSKSWVFRGRRAKRDDWVKWKLGDYPPMTPKAARAAAAAARADALAGRTYAPTTTEAIPEAAPEGCSVSEVWTQYKALRLEPECRESTVAEHSRIFAAHIEPVIGSRDVSTITKTDVLPIADKAMSRGFYARNKTVAVLTSFLGEWCHIKRDLIAVDPTRGIEQTVQKATKRKAKRALDDDEVAAVWKACDEIDDANLATVRFGAMFKLMLLTGCRRNEVAGMSDSEIKGNVWTVPGRRTKNGKALTVHLTKTAQAIIKAIPRIEGSAYVFGPTGKTCKFGYSKAKNRIDAVAQIKPWRLHDLRRTFRTGLGRLGVAESIAERCVNHPPAGLVEIYDVHKYDGEMAAAWQAWEGHVLACL
jgi:integrase